MANIAFKIKLQQYKIISNYYNLFIIFFSVCSLILSFAIYKNHYLGAKRYKDKAIIVKMILGIHTAIQGSIPPLKANIVAKRIKRI